MRRRPVSVTEFVAYTRRAAELLTAAEQDAVIDLVAYDPTRGDLIRAPVACANCGSRSAAAENAAERG